MESVLESHGPCESLELSKVRIGLETTELQRRKRKPTLWLGRRPRASAGSSAPTRRAGAA